MEKIHQLVRFLKKKSVKIHLGDRTFRMRLLTLSLFALAVLILLVAILILVISLSCSPAAEEIPGVGDPGNTATSSVTIPEPETDPEQETDPELGDPVDPGEPFDDVEPIPDDVEVVDPELPDDSEPIPETPAPSSEPVSSSGPYAFTGTIKKNTVSETVRIVQQRLVDLYYMDYPDYNNGSPAVTNKFGSTTSEAVKIFQERNGLSPSGECDEATYNLLVSNTATAYILKKGDKWGMVKTIQTKLKELGYLDSKVTGTCGDDTITAVKAFQQAKGISPDGIAGPSTLRLLLGH